MVEATNAALKLQKQILLLHADVLAEFPKDGRFPRGGLSQAERAEKRSQAKAMRKRLEYEMRRHAGQHNLVADTSGAVRCTKCLAFGNEAAQTVCRPSPVLAQLSGLERKTDHEFMTATLKQSSRLGAPAPWEGKPIVWCLRCGKYASIIVRSLHQETCDRTARGMINLQCFGRLEHPVYKGVSLCSPIRLWTKYQMKREVAAAPVVLDVVQADGGTEDRGSECSSDADTDDLVEQLGRLIDEEAVIAQSALSCHKGEVEPEEEFSFHGFSIG